MRFAVSRTLVPLCSSLLIGVIVLGQDEARQVRETVDDTVAIEQEVQQAADDWAVEKAALQARFRAARTNVEYLAGRKAAETEQADALTASVVELERRLTESTRLEAVLQDSLDAILLRLEDWVARDLPFLPTERRARLDDVQAEVAHPDVTAAEKLRRVLEALQIEAAYGATVEVYPQTIDLDGERLLVDVLRVGRLSLFWRTPDGSLSGEYDRAVGAWIELPGRHDRTIARAMEMATRMRPTELIALPLGRIGQAEVAP